uniref:Uncharacterized protein n=1 Tax=Rhizophora mucronata TaxID=61149 RepID=A0A2P2N1P7_RHIMU
MIIWKGEKNRFLLLSLVKPLHTDYCLVIFHSIMKS